MKFLSNLHSHTLYSDGENKPEDYIKLAIESGFVSFGFSDHAPIVIDGAVQNVFTMSLEGYEEYIKEINFLKEKYKDSIQIYLGIEEDYCPEVERDRFDFTIGAVHLIMNPETGVFEPVDKSPEDFEIAARRLGGIRKFVDMYYDALANMILEKKPDIVAHFDLITKYNNQIKMIDTESDWYQKSADKALEAVAQTGIIVEVNTGAVGRYKTEPYPDKYFLSRMLDMGIPVTISSDCHALERMDYWFDDSLKILREIGFKTVKQLYNNEFIDIDI